MLYIRSMLSEPELVIAESKLVNWEFHSELFEIHNVLTKYLHFSGMPPLTTDDIDKYKWVVILKVIFL